MCNLNKVSSFFIISFFLSFLSLFSIPVDISLEQTSQKVSLHFVDGSAQLELSNFKSDTLYVLKIHGNVTVLSAGNDPMVTFGANNSILIENERQLSGDDVVLINLASDQSDAAIQLEKVFIDTALYPNFGNEGWGSYIDATRDAKKPSEAIVQLNVMTRDAPLIEVLTLGCESGRDPLYWAKNGSNVTILDGTPHAVAITSLRLAEINALSRLRNVLACTLEGIPDNLGLFDAVTGSAVYSFIHPDQFSKVISERILSHVATSGYFAGEFLGPDHGWAEEESMTFISLKELQELFTQNGFEIIWWNEIKKKVPTVFNGEILWHEYQIIAQKN